jgi:1-acyl-sn-glycerol-3-phosphate acyltransferase
MAAFKPGIGILMAERKQPVIPVYLKGNYEAYPKGAAGLPKRLPLTAIIGEPMVFEQYASTSDNWYHVAKEVEIRVVELKKQLEQMTTKG